MLEEGILELPKGIFRSCGKLEQVELPATLEKIDCFAFASCRNLKKIYIPENVTHISYSVFTKGIMIYGESRSEAGPR